MDDKIVTKDDWCVTRPGRVTMHYKILFSRGEAAQALRVSVDTVAALIANGELRAVRIGKAVRITRGELERLIERGQAQTRDGS
jgi:excisionase family DNA binding protein